LRFQPLRQIAPQQAPLQAPRQVPPHVPHTHRQHQIEVRRQAELWYVNNHDNMPESILHMPAHFI